MKKRSSGISILFWVYLILGILSLLWSGMVLGTGNHRCWADHPTRRCWHICRGELCFYVRQPGLDRARRYSILPAKG